MKKIFLIITLLFNSVLYAKNNNDTINLAEQTIIDEDYGKALGLYLAKSKTDKMHTIDIHNALVCAILTKDEDAIKHFGNLFAEKGLPEKYFLEKKIFSSLKNKTYWKETARKSQKLYERSLTEHKDFINSIDSITNQESTINNDRQAMLSRNNNEYKDSALYYESIMRINEKALCDLFKSNFFPGDNLISQYLIKYDTLLTFSPKFYSVIVHCYQSWYNNEDNMFTPLLKKEVKSGNIKPETFAYMQDMGNLTDIKDRDYYGTQHLFTKHSNKLYALKLNYSDPIKNLLIETNRKNVGLCTLNEFINKIKFVQSGKASANGFIIYGNVSVYSNALDEEAYLLID